MPQLCLERIKGKKNLIFRYQFKHEKITKIDIHFSLFP